jgi:hypothetical protein
MPGARYTGFHHVGVGGGNLSSKGKKLSSNAKRVWANFATMGKTPIKQSSLYFAIVFGTCWIRSALFLMPLRPKGCADEVYAVSVIYYSWY